VSVEEEDNVERDDGIRVLIELSGGSSIKSWNRPLQKLFPC